MKTEKYLNYAKGFNASKLASSEYDSKLASSEYDSKLASSEYDSKLASSGDNFKHEINGLEENTWHEAKGGKFIEVKNV